MRLADKTALITGGNSGIGLATARLFLAEGARVAIVGRNKKTLDAAAEMLGADVLAIQADVTDVESTERAVATTAERFGKLAKAAETASARAAARAAECGEHRKRGFADAPDWVARTRWLVDA